MTRPARIVIVEALTSGTGLDLVHSAVQSGVPTTFVTRDPRRYANDSRKDLLTGPDVDVRVAETRSGQVLGELLADLARTGEITLICPNEQFMPATLAGAQAADVRYLSAETVRLAHDKRAFRQACRDAGLPAPASEPARTVDEARAVAARIGYPVVLKPSIGTGSYGVVAADDEKALAAAFPEAHREAVALGGGVLVEEFLIGPVISAEVLVSGGHTDVLGISDRVMSPMPYFLELAIRFPVELGRRTHEQITDQCTRLVELLDYPSGPAHIEFALTASGPRVIEFNPRFGGGNISRMVSAALGWNTYDAVVASHLGERVVPPAPIAGAAEQSLFAARAGIFAGVGGRELAGRVPGLRSITITAALGAELHDAKDQRGEYGTLWCVGDTAAEAGIRASAAAGYLSAITLPAGHQPMPAPPSTGMIAPLT